MSYVLNFKNQDVDLITKLPIIVEVGTTDSIRTSLNLTGKGAGNYGVFQQNNLLRLLDNFADTTAPSAPTVGQLWYDSLNLTLKIYIDSAPPTWRSVGGLQVTGIGEGPPTLADLGDIWFQRTGNASGFLHVYTGLGRYPQTDTTIGGWEQTYPAVETFGGREEYDTVRELVEQLAGESTSSYGSGAIDRSIANLTNFGALDRDLRLKFAALGPDTNVLLSTVADIEITKQAIGTTLFLHTDESGAGPNDAYISGSATNLAVAGSIFINNISTPVAPGVLAQNLFVEDGFIMWDSANALSQPDPQRFVVVRYNAGAWSYDNNTAFVLFTPTAFQYIIGTISTFQLDNNNIFPGGRNAFMWAHAVPIIGIKSTALKLEPNAQDWDTLLAAAKYALNRLDLPSNFVSAIADTPFVYDGRQAPNSLTTLSTTNIRYPSAARRANRKTGIVTQVQNFTETINALSTAIGARFSLRGINGASSSNSTFNSTTTITNHMSSSGVVASGAGDIRVKFRFANQSELTRWLYSGQGLQLEVVHIGGGSAGDTQLRALLALYGTWRLSADKTRFFGQSAPLTASASTVNQGLWNATVNGPTIAMQTVGVASMSVRVFRSIVPAGPGIAGTIGSGSVGSGEFEVLVVLNAGATLTGTTTVAFNLINDIETYLPGTLRTYSSPLTFVAEDITNLL